MSVKLYLCTYSEYPTIFSRHFITGISLCRELGSQLLSELQGILNEKTLATLTRQKEILITSRDLIIALKDKLHLPIKEIAEINYILIRLAE
jgi:hypothetical protein